MPVYRKSILSSQKLRWIFIALLFIGAFAVRIYRLDAVDLRGDEAYSVVLWTTTPFSDKWLDMAQHEPHPAGAYLLYWAWNGLMGTSVFATRLMSVMGNLVGMAVIMVLARRIFKNWQLAIMVAVLWAVNPFLIWHAQDARTYGVLSALTPLTFYFFIQATESESNPRKSWLFYILMQTLTLYLYYFEPFWMVAQGLYVLSLRNGAILKRAIRAWVMVLILAIPVGVQLYTLMFVSEYEGNAASASVTLLFENFVPGLLFGELNTIPVIVGIVLVGLYAGGLMLASRTYPVARLILLWSVIPPILLYAAAYQSSFLRVRYVATVTPALLIGIVMITRQFAQQIFRPENKFSGVVSQGLKPLVHKTSSNIIIGTTRAGQTPAVTTRAGQTPAVTTRAGQTPAVTTRAGQTPAVTTRAGQTSLRPAPTVINPIAKIFLAVMIVISVKELHDYFYHDPPKAPNWRGMAAYLEDRATSQDVIILGMPDPAMPYYYDGIADYYALPPGDTYQPDEFETLLKNYNGFYLLMNERTGDIKYFLEDQQHLQFISGDSYPGMVQYRKWDVIPDEIQQTVENIQFDDIARLQGYTLLEGLAGGKILFLYLEALTQTAQEYSVLFHIVPAEYMPENLAEAPAIRSLDHGVAGSVISTTQWQPGTVYRDPVVLPDDLPPGRYAILVGLYPTQMHSPVQRYLLFTFENP